MNTYWRIFFCTVVLAILSLKQIFLYVQKSLQPRVNVDEHGSWYFSESTLTRKCVGHAKKLHNCLVIYFIFINRFQVAQFSAQLENYEKAVQIYEQASRLKSPDFPSLISVKLYHIVYDCSCSCLKSKVCWFSRPRDWFKTNWRKGGFDRISWNVYRYLMTDIDLPDKPFG